MNGACIEWSGGSRVRLCESTSALRWSPEGFRDAGGRNPENVRGQAGTMQGGEVERVILRMFFRNFIRRLSVFLRGGKAVGSYLT